LESLKQALRRLAKAVVVITSAHEGVRYAMSATAVCEVSMDPPSFLICVNKSASIYPALASKAPFVINILHYTHEAVARNCAGAIKGQARFAEGNWGTLKNGVPVLRDAQASIICDNWKTIDHGTHGIFIGGVTEVHVNGEPDPLVYIDGRFTRVCAVETGCI